MKDSPMEVSRDYLNRASNLIAESKRCFERLDYSLCVLRSAESVEFSLKAALLTIGETHQREHDVSGDLYRAYPKFPEWFRKEVPRLAIISKTFALLSLPAKYGDQKLEVAPSQLFRRPEAEAYLQIAQDVLSSCNRLYWEAQADKR